MGRNHQRPPGACRTVAIICRKTIRATDQTCRLPINLNRYRPSSEHGRRGLITGRSMAPCRADAVPSFWPYAPIARPDRPSIQFCHEGVFSEGLLWRMAAIAKTFVRDRSSLGFTRCWMP
ncbi:unnamed protein product [Soboliphyme baturini]|uniref:Uncharacterized protein n=1 Tax=Soboliphyme baturini TaxID=241478 RepID=A0A183IF79_9BILA|nr:unnamed protein product [Soboliphyme baturini]